MRFTPLLAFCFDPTPLLVVANVVVVAIVFLISSRIGSKHGRFVVGGLIAVSLIWWVAFAIWTGVKQRVSVPMTWEINPTLNPHPEAKQTHVVFYFKRNPKQHIGVYSDKVAEYLQGFPSKEVDVVFDVTKDFGRVRATHEVQIGELKRWSEEGCGYAGGSSSVGPSPWP